MCHGKTDLTLLLAQSPLLSLSENSEVSDGASDNDKVESSNKSDAGNSEVAVKVARSVTKFFCTSLMCQLAELQETAPVPLYRPGQCVASSPPGWVVWRLMELPVLFPAKSLTARIPNEMFTMPGVLACQSLWLFRTVKFITVCCHLSEANTDFVLASSSFLHIACYGSCTFEQRQLLQNKQT